MDRVVQIDYKEFGIFSGIIGRRKCAGSKFVMYGR